MSLGFPSGQRSHLDTHSLRRFSVTSECGKGQCGRRGREPAGARGRRAGLTCCVRSHGRGGVCSRGGPWSPGLWSYAVSGRRAVSEVAGGPGALFAGLAVVAWTLVVCGQWVTCCVQSRARGAGCVRGVGRGRRDFGRMRSVGRRAVSEVAGGAGCVRGVGRGRLDFGRMWSVGDVLCPKSREGRGMAFRGRGRLDFTVSAGSGLTEHRTHRRARARRPAGVGR